jgi:hypothetical protein
VLPFDVELVWRSEPVGVDEPVVPAGLEAPVGADAALGGCPVGKPETAIFGSLIKYNVLNNNDYGFRFSISAEAAGTVKHYRCHLPPQPSA